MREHPFAVCFNLFNRSLSDFIRCKQSRSVRGKASNHPRFISNRGPTSANWTSLGILTKTWWLRIKWSRDGISKRMCLLTGKKWNHSHLRKSLLAYYPLSVLGTNTWVCHEHAPQVWTWSFQRWDGDIARKLWNLCMCWCRAVTGHCSEWDKWSVHEGNAIRS